MDKEKLKQQIVKFLRYALVAGLGWVVDFAIYTALSVGLGWAVTPSNFVSSVIAVTLVFFLSKSKVLTRHNEKIPVQVQYLLYILYRLAVIALLSWLAGYVHRFLLSLSWFTAVELLRENVKPITKILITPFTVLINYIALCWIAEGREKHVRG